MKMSDQFIQRELTTKRRIANLREHVERAIERIKNFKLLHNFPNNMAHVADQIFFVYTILSNFHGPLCNNDRKIIKTCHTYEICRMINKTTSWDTSFQGA